MPEDTAESAPSSAAPENKSKERSPYQFLVPCWYSLASVWALIWVACAIWMALGTLVATQSHDRLNSLRDRLAVAKEQPHGGSLLSIDELVALLDSREEFLARRRAHEFEQLDVVSEIGQLELLVKDAQENYEQLLRQANDGPKTGMESKAGAAVFRPMGFEPISAAEPEESLVKAAEAHAKVSAQLQSAKAREAGLAARITYIQTRLDQFKLDPELEILGKDVRCVSSILGLFFYLPSYMVTLLLTLAMGALGSVIFTTHKLFKGKSEQPNHRASWYFMRPFLGMTLAFAMYILAQAGQFAMTDPSGAVSDLNPFTIAFLGIISGLLAENVYDLIVRTGERWFTRDSAPPKPGAIRGYVSADSVLSTAPS